MAPAACAGSQGARESEEVTALLSRLVLREVPQIPDPDDPSAHRLLQYTLRILASRVGSAPLLPLRQSAELARRRLVQRGRAQDALGIGELLSHLQPAAASFPWIPSALQMLCALMHSTSPGATAPASAATYVARGAFGASSAAPPIPPIPSAADIAAPEPLPAGLPRRAPLTLAASAPPAAAASMAAAPSASASVSVSASASYVGSAPVGSTAKGKSRGAVAAKVKLSEAEIVRELLFVMQNIDGAHLKWNAEADAFALVGSKSYSLPPGVHQLTGRLCELGWLFRQVAEYVADVGVGADAAAAKSTALAAAGGVAARSGAVGGSGLVAQALKHALQAELHEWYQLLAVLEAQRRAELSLLQLLVWSTEPLRRLVTLVQLVKSCGQLKGGAMTVGMCRLERHGDPQVAGYVKHLLRQACAPLFDMLRRWLHSGELTDPYHEFFIEQNAATLERLWDERFKLRTQMLPCFITRQLAQQVLLVGKTINFIRLACLDSGWAVQLSPSAVAAAAAAATAATAVTGDARAMEPSCAASAGVSASGSAAALPRAALEYGQEGVLEASVRLSAAAANARLLELLLGKYQLRQHCANLKRFLLLGKGDFVQYLMEHLAPHLSRDASELHRHQMLSLLESAVRSCSLSSPEGGSEAESLVLEHLDVRLLQHPGASGWEAFSLDYHAAAPIAVVISTEAMAQYRQVFTFLWRLKRVEHSLTAVWRKHGTAARIVQTRRRDWLMHSCHCLRNEMIHFVYNLQYYLMFEVLECSWQELMSKLSAATDLDAVIDAHNTFLRDVVQKSLLAPETASLYRCLKELFETILQFSKAQDVLYMYLLEQTAAARQQAAAAAANTAGGQWGCSGGLAADRIVSGALELKPHFRQQLITFSAEYKHKFSALFHQVTRHASLDLAFLSFRLDFNLYYESLSEERAQREGVQAAAMPNGVSPGAHHGDGVAAAS